MGAWDGALYLSSRVLAQLSGGRVRLIKYYIVAQPVAAAPPLRNDPNTVLRFAGADDPLVGCFPRPPEVIARRYRHGSRCLAALVKGEFAGFLWWQHGAYEEDEVRCLYVLADPEHSVWDYDVHVEPHFRLGRTLARLWQTANEHLQAQGIGWSFSRISAFNPASLRSHARLGMRPHQCATFLAIGRLQLSWFGSPPFFHLSLSPRSTPTLRLVAPR